MLHTPTLPAAPYLPAPMAADHLYSADPAEQVADVRVGVQSGPRCPRICGWCSCSAPLCVWTRYTLLRDKVTFAGNHLED